MTTRLGLSLARITTRTRTSLALRSNAQTKITRQVRYASDTAGNTANASTNAGEKPGIMSRLKTLTKKYGWSTLAVYSGISALDLGASFVLVKIGGADRIAEIEHKMMDSLGGWIVMKKAQREGKDPELVKKEEKEKHPRLAKLGTAAKEQGRDQVQNAKSSEPSLWTVFIIAYGIHKVLLPLRVGLTAALTPPIVKRLQKMGWNVGRNVVTEGGKAAKATATSTAATAATVAKATATKT